MAKSPAEDPELGADHHYPDDLADIITHLDAKAEELYGSIPSEEGRISAMAVPPRERPYESNPPY